MTTVQKLVQTLEIPPRAKKLGIQKITVRGNRQEHIVTIQYKNKDSEFRWYTSLNEKIDLIERAMKLLGLDLEARSWVVVITQLYLEQELSN